MAKKDPTSDSTLVARRERCKESVLIDHDAPCTLSKVLQIEVKYNEINIQTKDHHIQVWMTRLHDDAFAYEVWKGALRSYDCADWEQRENKAPQKAKEKGSRKK